MSNILQTRAEFSATAAIAERTEQSTRAPWMVTSMFIDDYKSPWKSLYPEEAGNCTDIFPGVRSCSKGCHRICLIVLSVYKSCFSARGEICLDINYRGSVETCKGSVAHRSCLTRVGLT